MKKIIAVLLAVLMLSGLATMALAATSPIGEIEHLVIVRTRLGTKETSYSFIVPDGDTITVNAPDYAGYEFVSMVVFGNYEEVNRTVKTYTSRTINILPKSDIEIIITYAPYGGHNDDGFEIVSGNYPGPSAPSAPVAYVDYSATSPDTGA